MINLLNSLVNEALCRLLKMKTHCIHSVTHFKDVDQLDHNLKMECFIAAGLVVNLQLMLASKHH